jgi:hypothetical protein
MLSSDALIPKYSQLVFNGFWFSPDRAIVALQKLRSIPYEAPLASGVPLTPALLRLDPRFQKLVDSGAPK